jgi:hypothetical protein
MPAIALGVRTAFAARGHDLHEPRATDAYAVASRDLGVVRLHAGVDALSASVDGHRAAARLRPLAGLEVHPPMYPRSSLLADLAWEPTLAAQGPPTLGWLLGIGVRYHAFSWASVELAVRARQAEDLGASTVMVRLNAVLARRAAMKPPGSGNQAIQVPNGRWLQRGQVRSTSYSPTVGSCLTSMIAMPTAPPIAAAAALEPAPEAAVEAAAAAEREPQRPGASWLVITLFRGHDRDGSYTIALRRSDHDGRR